MQQKCSQRARAGGSQQARCLPDHAVDSDVQQRLGQQPVRLCAAALLRPGAQSTQLALALCAAPAVRWSSEGLGGACRRNHVLSGLLHAGALAQLHGCQDFSRLHVYMPTMQSSAAQLEANKSCVPPGRTAEGKGARRPRGTASLVAAARSCQRSCLQPGRAAGCKRNWMRTVAKAGEGTVAAAAGGGGGGAQLHPTLAVTWHPPTAPCHAPIAWQKAPSSLKGLGLLSAASPCVCYERSCGVLGIGAGL